MNQISTNIGAFVTSRFALARTAFGAGVGNLAATNGEAFQRTTKRPLHLSGKLIVGVKCTIASGQSLSLTAAMKDSEAGSVYTDTLASTTEVITGLDSGAEQKVTVEVDFNLIGGKDYIRPTISGTLTQSGVSTAEIFAVMILGGGETSVPSAFEPA